LLQIIAYVAISSAVDIFVDVYVSLDQRNVSRRLLHFDQGGLGLGASARDYYLNTTRYAKQMAAYHKFQVAKISLIAQGLREEEKLETKKKN
jgi:predicted metalloendopeptidase